MESDQAKKTSSEPASAGTIDDKAQLAKRGWLDKQDNPWYVCAIWTSAVAAAFCLIVGGVLATEFVSGALADPTNSPKLADLKAKITQNPDDASLKTAFQNEDLLVRAEKLRIDRLVRIGAWMLLAGAGVLLVCGGYIALCTLALPSPKSTAGDQSATVERSAGLGRIAVGGLFGILVLAGIVASQQIKPTPAPAGATGRNYPAAGATATEPANAVASSAKTEGTPATLPSEKEYEANWPKFRGPTGQGISMHSNIPTKWDGPENKGIKWKTAIPLPGQNSPIVWGNKIFLSGATPEKREVYCVDADSGKILWQTPIASKQGKADPAPNVMEETGYAAPTMATDGLRVFAMFANGDLACLDFEGKVLWTKYFGPMQVNYGYASSLITWKSTLIVVLDVEAEDTGKNAIVAFDSASGNEVWQTARNAGFTWMTPTIIRTPGGEQLVTLANPWAIAYEPEKGNEIWRATVAGGDVAASPVYGGGMVFLADKNSQMAAVKPDGKGNVSKSHIVWTSRQDLPDIVSPLTDGKRVWIITSEGLVVCRAIKDGSTLYSQDIKQDVKASPTLVGDKIYLLDCSGLMTIIAADNEFKKIGTCNLGEATDATPAFMDGRIYIRGKKNLYCITGEK